MKKINLNADDKQHLASLIGTNAPGIGVLKKILKHYTDELRDVRSIDPKKNVGLQTVAAQKALDVLIEFEDEVFNAAKPRIVSGGPEGQPQKRPYQ